MRRVLALAALVAGFGPVAAAGASTTTTAYVNCAPLKISATAKQAPPFTAEQHPARCNLQGEPEDLDDLVQLSAAHWSGWGTAAATATGSALAPASGMGAHPTSSPVTIALSRIETGCHGKRLYTRATITQGKGKGAVLKLSDGCTTTPV